MKNNILAISQSNNTIDYVGHEVKSYITNIKVYVQLLLFKLQKANEPDMRTYVEKININVDELTEVINNLLEAQRIISGNLSLHNEIVDIQGSITNVIERVKINYARHIKLNSALTQAYTMGDTKRLENAFYQIIKNAVIFSDSGSSIEVSITVEKKEILITVEDYGIGMGSQELQSLFTPFSKGEKAFFKQRRLGIGAYLSQGIIHAHKGKMDIQSRLEKGTKVFMIIPVRRYE